MVLKLSKNDDAANARNRLEAGDSGTNGQQNGEGVWVRMQQRENSSLQQLTADAGQLTTMQHQGLFVDDRLTT